MNAAIPFPKDQISALEKLENEAMELVKKYRLQKRDMEESWARDAFGIKEGDIVEARGERYVVDSIASIYSMYCSLNGRRIKKDGSPSLATRYLGATEWKKVV